MSPKPARETTAQKYRDIPLELLFDLVFAFAIPQCSDYLGAHLTWRGAAETLVLLLATVLLWSVCSWVAIIVGAERPATRWMMLAMMLPALFLNASVTKALEEAGWTFVIPFLVLQVMRIGSAIVLAPRLGVRQHYYRVMAWSAFSMPLWLMGAAAETGHRLGWWGSAMGIDLLGAILAHPTPWQTLHSKYVPFDGDHMLERCRQFLIIALGQTVITAGEALAGAPVRGMSLVTGSFILLEMVALWLLMFGSPHRSIVRYVVRTQDPIRAVRFAVTATLGIVTGFIASAVANREVIERPEDPLPTLLGVLVWLGPFLLFFSQGWYLRLILKVRSNLQWIGMSILLLAGLCVPVLPAYGAQALVAACLMGLVAWDRRGTDR